MSDIFASMKKLFDALLKKHGSYDRLEELSGIRKQKLWYWHNKSSKFEALFGFLVWAKKDLRVSNTEFIDELTPKGKE